MKQITSVIILMIFMTFSNIIYSQEITQTIKGKIVDNDSEMAKMLI